MPKDLTPIYIDDREPVEEYYYFFSFYPGYEPMSKRLVVGDVVVGEELIFERKTLKDFAISIFDGRLFSQCGRMLASLKQPILILEGTSADLKNTKINRETIQGALVTISLSYKIPVLRSLNLKETCSLIINCSKRINSITTGDVSRYGKQPHGKHRQQLLLLQSLPNIGKEKAKLLLKQFGSIENVIKASYEELQDVEGIGRKTASQIRYVLSEERAEYGTQQADLLFDI